jgi:hypothetical protein
MTSGIKPKNSKNLLMRHLLQKTVLFGFILLAAVFQESRANSLLGSELTYKYLSPDIYQIKLKLYYDCIGTNAPKAVNVNVNSPGCNSGQLITLNLAGAVSAGNPYCSFIPQSCDSIRRANYLQATYQGIVNFSPFKGVCSDWIIGFSDSNRVRTANLDNASSQNFYTEAYLNLAPGINNNSPEIPVFSKTINFVGVAQKNSLQTAVHETECDSLSYELVPVLSAANTPCSYVPITSVISPGTYFPNPNPHVPYCNSCNPANNQVGYFAGTPGTNFSSVFPLPSFTANWNAINPATGIPYQIVPVHQYFVLEQSGAIRLWPAIHLNTRPALGKNKYVVAVKINEWRKINNVFVKVGNIRRDMAFIVEDLIPMPPELTNIQVNGRAYPADTIIDLQPGHNLQLTFNTADADTQDVVSIESDVAGILPGATFTTTAGARPSAAINWSGALVNNCHQIRYFHLILKDNSCPIYNAVTYTFGVRVSTNSSGFKTSTQTSNFLAYPNPFSKAVNFKIKEPAQAREIRIYNLLGREIDRITVPAFSSGEQEVVWEGAVKLPAGQYLAKMIGTQMYSTLKFTKLQ